MNRTYKRNVRLLGKLTRSKRIGYGLSVSQVAAKAGVNYSTVYRFENGATVPRLETITAIIGATEYLHGRRREDGRGE